MRDFRKLNVWEEAHKVILSIYKSTRNFSQEELYCLTLQLRKAAISIPNNIAEGCGRNSKKALYNFLNISRGSSSEVEYLLLLSYDLEYLDRENYSSLSSQLVQVRKKLNLFMQQICDDINVDDKRQNANGKTLTVNKLMANKLTANLQKD
ncbi:MAG TPA: four helix bundle protein [Candidatus Cloacimonadota bacterium]|nr:four helix bundle protein [Candidatus Cloacimonadota bacterium]